MGLRQRCQEVYQAAKKLGIKSVRVLARATNLSKSSVHRLRQRIKRRHQGTESDFWETPEGF
jgi:HD-like signal output (HDOD) protein